SGSVTGRGKALTNFTVSMGTATLKTAASGTNPINFRIGPIGKNSSKTFYVGADFPIGADGTGSTGAASSSFYVWADDANPPYGARRGRGPRVAGGVRRMRRSKAAGLAFGGIVKPVSGGTVTVGLPAQDSSKPIPSGVAWMNLPIPTRAAYSVSGEGGQTLAI